MTFNIRYNENTAETYIAETGEIFDCVEKAERTIERRMKGIDNWSIVIW